MAHKCSTYDDAPGMYEQGLSIGDIARFYGVTRQAMWLILSRRGVRFRSKLRYGTDNHFWRGSSDDDAAQGIVEKAIVNGLLVPASECSSCGASYRMKDGRRGIHAHHCDYNKPLDVMWLCQRCHHEWHKHNQAIPRTT